MNLLTRLWHRFWFELRIQNRHARTGPRFSRAAVRNPKRSK